MTTTPTRPVWAEVNLAAIAANVRVLGQSLSPDCKLMAVVKANAYGHGDCQVAREALANGASWLAVAHPEEGVRLRRDGIGAPILVLGSIHGRQLELCITKDLVPTVFQWEVAASLANLARKYQKTVRIHLKVDTGMGRFGLAPEEVCDFARKVRGLPNVELQGVYTHFASADRPDEEYVHWQWSRFNRVIQELTVAGINIPIKHCANSAATMFLPETHLDLVRVGIGLYGLYPSTKRPLSLQPALSLKAKVIATKRVPPGSAVSYGSTYVTWKETTIVTLPLGYADGVSRLLGNRGQVIINHQVFPIVGRVCMDALMVDVGDYPVEVGDEAVLIGKQGDQEITIDDWADLMGTINYEVPCLLTARVPRVYVP